MVYGTTFHLPGEFSAPSQTSSLPDPSDYVSNLRTHMQTIQPPPPHPNEWNTNIINGLSTVTHVFMMLSINPYDGPYRVIKKTDKHFTIDINGRNNTVSINRLKPAHLHTDNFHPTSQTAPPTTQPCRTTHSGQHVHFPQYLSQHVVRHWGGGGQEWCSELSQW